MVLSFQIHVTFQSAFRHSVTNGCPPIHAVIQHYICQVLQANTNYIQLLCFRLITFLLLSPSALQLWNFRFSIPPSQHQCTENSTCAVVALRRVCSAPSLITATCHSNFAGNLQKIWHHGLLVKEMSEDIYSMFQCACANKHTCKYYPYFG